MGVVQEALKGKELQLRKLKLNVQNGNPTGTKSLV